MPIFLTKSLSFKTKLYSLSFKSKRRVYPSRVNCRVYPSWVNCRVYSYFGLSLAPFVIYMYRKYTVLCFLMLL